MELLIKIYKLLDLLSICNLSQTCHMLHNITYEPFLYMQLNLKNYWWLVNDSTLDYLGERCSQLQQLDLSWCGPYDSVTSTSFMQFIHQCGHHLICLRLNNCHFVDNYCLYMIANVCVNLEELSLANCNDVDHLGFGELKKLNKLIRLDLSRTRIDFRTLPLVLQYAGKLQHLNVHNCLNIDMDDVAITLARFNKCLISLGAWKTRGLTSKGIRSLACIKTLEDLDFGWS